MSYTFLRAAALGAAVYASLAAGGQRRQSGVATVLMGSSSALDEQNRKMREYNLSKIPDNEALRRMVRGGYLIRMPMRTRHYYLDEDLSGVAKHNVKDPALSRRYARPWVKTFIERLSSQYYMKCSTQMRINSLVRTEEDQRLIPNGSERSPHPTGSAVDIANINMCPSGRAWARRVLADLDRKGYIEATEERRPPHFHVMVYPSYKNYVASLAKKPAKKPPQRKRPL